MKSLKRFSAVLLSCLLFSMTFMPVSADDDRGVRSFSGNTGNFYAGTGSEYDYDIKLDLNWFIYGDNTRYSRELSKVALTSSTVIYGTGSGNAAYSTAFLSGLGFSDIKFMNVVSETGYDTNDVTALIIGHREVVRYGKSYEIIFVTVRGSSTDADWYSNFDVGADTPSYYSLTGEHPEWTQKVMHKGFAVAANRAKSKIDQYQSENVDPSAEKIILLTGHSRGAAIANILGTFYEDDSEEYLKSFTYTYATPATTTVSQETADSYQTIFNVINTDDLVPYLPAKEWGGFKCYGTCLYDSTLNHTDRYTSICGASYSSAGGSSLGASVATIASTREALYEPDRSSMGTIDKGWHVSQLTAQTLYDQAVSTYGSYAEVHMDTGTWVLGITNYHVYVYLRPVYVMNLLVQCLTADDTLSMLTTILSYSLTDGYLSILTSLATPATDGSINSSHMSPAYYAILENDFGYDQSLFMPESEVQKLHRMISELGDPEYTSAYYLSLQACRIFYDSLGEDDRGEISNYEKLTETESAYQALEDTQEPAQVVISSRCEGGDVTVANLTGGGCYKISGGDISAPEAPEGLIFAGWYSDYSPEENGTLFSEEATVHLNPEEDLYLTAVYTSDEEVTFDVKVSAEKYTVSCDSRTREDEQTFSVRPGELFTVSYADPDYEFLFWKNEENRVLGRSRSVSLAATGDTAFIAVAIPSSLAEYCAYLRFTGPDGESISEGLCLSFNAIPFPEAPELEGKSFIGWSMTQEEIRAAMTEKNEINVKAVYE